MSTSLCSLPSSASRQRAVAFVLRLTQGTRLEPQAHEQHLLQQFVEGTLTLEELTRLLEAPLTAS
jgi:hypothetical protein